MSRAPDSFVDFGQALQYCRVIAQEIKTSGWQPDLVVGLAGSGFFPAVWIAKLLGDVPVVGLSVTKANGVRSIGDHAYLASDQVYGRHVLVIDDTTITGKLLTDARVLIERLNGETRTAALVAVGNCPPPDYRGYKCEATPQMFWEITP